MTAITGQIPAGPARPAAAREPVADEGHPRRWWILAVLGALAFMAQPDLFIVNVALPTIGHSLGAWHAWAAEIFAGGLAALAGQGLATTGRSLGDGAAQSRPLTGYRGAR